MVGTTSSPDDRAADEAQDALRKAGQHVRSAASNGRHGDFGLGYAHLVLALEEESKYFVFNAVAEGLATFDPERAGDRILLNRNGLFAHPFKHVLYGVSSLLFAVAEAAVSLSRAHASGQAVDQADVTTALFGAMTEVTETLPPVGELESKKQAGLYSGNQSRSGAPITEATEAEFRRLYPTVRRRIEFQVSGKGIPLPQELIERSREEVRERRAKEGPPQNGGDLAGLRALGK